MKEFSIGHAEMLYLRFSAIYQDKFVKSYHSDEFKKIWYEEWVSALAGIDVGLIKGVLEHCKLNLHWPPSMEEFRKLCEKALGIPSCAACLEGAIRGEFIHSIAYAAYIKVGSWAMQHDKEEVIRKKFDAAYQLSLNEFRVNPIQINKLLEVHLNKPILIEHQKHTVDEIKGFKERIKEYQERAAIDKANTEKMNHPKWENNRHRREAKQFSQEIFKKRRDYLLNLTDLEANTLDQESWYDRIKYCRELEGMEYLNKIGYTGKDA